MKEEPLGDIGSWIVMNEQVECGVAVHVLSAGVEDSRSSGQC